MRVRITVKRAEIINQEATLIRHKGIKRHIVCQKMLDDSLKPNTKRIAKQRQADFASASQQWGITPDFLFIHLPELFQRRIPLLQQTRGNSSGICKVGCAGRCMNFTLPYQGTITNRNGDPQNIDTAWTSIEIITLRHRLYDPFVGGSRAPSRMV